MGQIKNIKLHIVTDIKITKNMVSPPILRKLHCIAAMDAQRGIGRNGELPWNLPKELKSFAKLTTSVRCQSKQNAVIMGRLTYFSIPEKFRPLRNRLNIVLSNTLLPKDVPDNVLLCRSLDECMHMMSTEHYMEQIESLYVIGGSSVYNVAMSSSYCQRIYLTEVEESYECDTFFPQFDKGLYKEVVVDGVNQDQQEEAGIKYRLHVYSSGE